MQARAHHRPSARHGWSDRLRLAPLPSGAAEEAWCPQERCAVRRTARRVQAAPEAPSYSRMGSSVLKAHGHTGRAASSPGANLRIQASKASRPTDWPTGVGSARVGQDVDFNREINKTSMPAHGLRIESNMASAIVNQRQHRQSPLIKRVVHAEPQHIHVENHTRHAYTRVAHCAPL